MPVSANQPLGPRWHLGHTGRAFDTATHGRPSRSQRSRSAAARPAIASRLGSASAAGTMPG
jgi:hypothetical protein